MSHASDHMVLWFLSPFNNLNKFNWAFKLQASSFKLQACTIILLSYFSLPNTGSAFWPYAINTSSDTLWFGQTYFWYLVFVLPCCLFLFIMIFSAKKGSEPLPMTGHSISTTLPWGNEGTSINDLIHPCKLLSGMGTRRREILVVVKLNVIIVLQLLYTACIYLYK